LVLRKAEEKDCEKVQARGLWNDIACLELNYKEDREERGGGTVVEKESAYNMHYVR